MQLSGEKKCPAICNNESLGGKQKHKIPVIVEQFNDLSKLIDRERVLCHG